MSLIRLESTYKLQISVFDSVEITSKLQFPVFDPVSSHLETAGPSLFRLATTSKLQIPSQFLSFDWQTLLNSMLTSVIWLAADSKLHV